MPTIPINEVLIKIRKKYDLIITLFWQDMINSSTLKAIYDKQNCPILIYAPDMAPMTGGCFYFNKCDRYTKGCGKCPALNSNDVNDQTKKNILIKQENYKASNIAFLGNSWMLKHFNSSFLHDSCKQFNVGIVLDENKFIPFERSQRDAIRKHLNFQGDDFIILLRSTSEIRKGNNDILKSIELLQNNYVGGRCIRIVTVGASYFKDIANIKEISVLDCGQVSTDNLIELFNVADVFISASIDDAGPSMINQALMCGTPVISYDTGVALDVIKDDISGYVIDTGNIAQMALKLQNLILKEPNEYEILRKSSRKIAYYNNSKVSFANKILDIYNQLKENPKNTK
ncbi:MAG: glycosyltransferase [Bacteroides sp.]|nr:glycosyltransferase [Bacteroides sp.]